MDANSMFVREKRIGAYSYLYLVETVRENGKTKQRIIRNLGRTEVVAARGDLDRLARSAARLSQRSMILSLLGDDEVPKLSCRRIGAALLFERLWIESGCRGVMEEIVAGRRFEFAVERAVFLTVLHRLMVSGSDRACEHWREDYRIDGIESLQLHHLYRAMAFLGEELAETEQAGRTLAPRCIKDAIEEQLFADRRDLFSELSVAFMDTTSLYFEGGGGETLGQFGHGKDYRPHLKQMIVGVIMDQTGRPVCSEMWPGNTADVTTLVPVIDRLRQRFAIGKVCVVADRGMISAETIAHLEAAGWTTFWASGSAPRRKSARSCSTMPSRACRSPSRAGLALTPSSKPRRCAWGRAATWSAAISTRPGAMPCCARTC